MYKLNNTQIETFVTKSSFALYDYCRKNNIHYTVTGVSGGLDSAVTLALAEAARTLAKKDGYKLNNIALLLPCITDKTHMIRAKEVIDKCNAEMIEINLDDIFYKIQSSLQNTNALIEKILKKTDGEIFTKKDLLISEGNIKARLRMMLGTYHIARLVSGIVLSTDNYSEYLMGFWTICGDVGDFGMLQNIYKGLELYDIARYLKIPESIIDATPDDGLGITEGGDESQIGVDYRTLDILMVKYMNEGKKSMLKYATNRNISTAKIDSILKRHQDTAYKRIGPINLKREELGLPELCLRKL